MKKTILVFGLISGAIASVLMIATVPFSDSIGFDRGEYVGYTLIILSMLLVYFGIRSYRDNVANGHITFAKAFLVGISIAVISCICYVVTWEIIYYNFMPDFTDKYAAYIVAKMQAQHASAAALQKSLEDVRKYKAMYDNPLTNAAITFIEPFPVGLIMTALSAAILRKKPQPAAAAAVAKP